MLGKPNNKYHVYDHFKLPIQYTKFQKLDENIHKDLELLESDESYPIYNYVFSPQNEYQREIVKSWASYYSVDIDFLKDTKSFLKTFKAKVLPNDISFWEPLKCEVNFLTNYHYIEIKRFESMNYSQPIVQLLSVYSILSPLISLFIPLFLLFVPFIILKFNSYPVTIALYFDSLKMLFSRHSFGKLFIINEVSWDKRVYIIMSIVVYFIQVYQNIISCLRFHTNMTKIHKEVELLSEYLNITSENLLVLYDEMNDYDTYKPFCDTMMLQHDKISSLKNKLSKINAYKWNVSEMYHLGYVKTLYYELKMDEDIHNTIMYTKGLNAFCGTLNHLRYMIKKKFINFGTFTKKESSFQQSYYPALLERKQNNGNEFMVDNNIVKNDCNMKQNMIITGPNASGKTTYLKTTLINYILTQQLGVGFYKSAKISLVDHFHCYLNIPDTSARDSLFQAEARRCHNIIEHVTESNDEKHLCIFDELYSGTNPEEATASSYGFIKYLSEQKNVQFLLTTHFIKMCEMVEDDKEEVKLRNYHMDVTLLNDDFVYNYVLMESISKLHGGIKVLIDLEYPSKVIEYAKKMLTQPDDRENEM